MDTINIVVPNNTPTNITMGNYQICRQTTIKGLVIYYQRGDRVESGGGDMKDMKFCAQIGCSMKNNLMVCTLDWSFSANNYIETFGGLWEILDPLQGSMKMLMFSPCDR